MCIWNAYNEEGSYIFSKEMIQRKKKYGFRNLFVLSKTFLKFYKPYPSYVPLENVLIVEILRRKTVSVLKISVFKMDEPMEAEADSTQPDLAPEDDSSKKHHPLLRPGSMGKQKTEEIPTHSLGLLSICCVVSYVSYMPVLFKVLGPLSNKSSITDKRKRCGRSWE